jgi:predicted nucleic acid-binding protein
LLPPLKLWLHASCFLRLASITACTPDILGYPKFKLDKDEQEALLADFLPYVETVQITSHPEGLPSLRDPDDVMFLVLSVAAKADALVSGDADIQVVKHQLKNVSILTVAEFAEWLEAH